MKKTILHLSDMDYGGAGNLALHYHRFFQKMEHESFLILKNSKYTDGKYILKYSAPKLKNIIEKTKRAVCRNWYKFFKFEDKYIFYNKFEQQTCYSSSLILNMLPKKPDVIFIYWVSGFINSKLINELATITGAKIYIWMIDNAPLTGGCHYQWDCNGYKKNCQNCPAISSKLIKQLAMQNLIFKKKYLPTDVYILSGSTSDYNRIKMSSLFKTHRSLTILGNVDETIFKPSDDIKSIKSYFQLPQDKKVIFFGSAFLNEERKGMAVLLKALELLNRSDIVLLIAGTTDLGVIEIENYKLGYLKESDLIKAYQVADVFVCPSLEDSGPMMINQAIMTGTPVVAFETGVAIDLVHIDKTGYRASLGDPIDLAKGINMILNLDEDKRSEMSKNCRILAVSNYGVNIFERKLSSLLD